MLVDSISNQLFGITKKILIPATASQIAEISWVEYQSSSTPNKTYRDGMQFIRSKNGEIKLRYSHHLSSENHGIDSGVVTESIHSDFESAYENAMQRLARACKNREIVGVALSGTGTFVDTHKYSPTNRKRMIEINFLPSNAYNVNFHTIGQGIKKPIFDTTKTHNWNSIESISKKWLRYECASDMIKYFCHPW